MGYLEAIYLGSTLVTVIAGGTLMGMGIRAYADTRRQQMVLLSVGFSIIVAATLATAAVAFATEFTSPRQLLVMNTGLSTCGYVLLVYSLVTY